MGMYLSAGIVFGWADDADSDSPFSRTAKRAYDYIEGNDDLNDENVDELDEEDWELNLGWPFSETLEARRRAGDDFRLKTKAEVRTTGVGDYEYSRYFGIDLAHGDDIVGFEPLDLHVSDELIANLKADAASMEIEVDGEPGWFITAHYW